MPFHPALLLLVLRHPPPLCRSSGVVERASESPHEDTWQIGGGPGFGGQSDPSPVLLLLPLPLTSPVLAWTASVLPQLCIFLCNLLLDPRLPYIFVSSGGI